MVKRIKVTRNTTFRDGARRASYSQFAKAGFAVVTAGFLSGCLRTLTPEEHQDQLRPRASYELNCPVSQVKFERMTGRIQEPRYRASGCGMELTYDLSCAHYDTCFISTNTELTDAIRAKQQADADRAARQLLKNDN